MKRTFYPILLLFFFSYTLLSSQEIGQDDIIVYGILNASPPFMFVNDHGDPDGFAVDLYSRMMGDLEMPYEFRVEKINILYKALLEGEIDLFTGMLYTKDNQEVFYFPHTSFKTSWGELFVGADVFYSDIYDLEGKTIGMVVEDSNGLNFVKFMDQFKINYYTQEFSTFSELFSAVRDGEIFGGISNSQYQKHHSDGGLQPTATTFHPSSTYAVTGRDKGNIEALEKLSNYLSELKSDPQSYYYELEKKWYTSQQNRLAPKVLRIILLSLLTLIVVILFLFLNVRYLKKEVNRQVKQINRQQAEKERVDLKNDVLTSISHELRTPMNIVTSLVYLLTQSDLDKNQRDKINKINNASHLLLNIINNFLDFNRLERGQIHIERHPFSPKGEFAELKSLFHDDVKDKGLYLESHLDENIPPVLWGDPLRLSQILTNLINNAVKFSKRGTISLAVFVEELSKNNCRLNITVKDQGIGIDEDKLEQLFLPFTQADDSISRQFGGSGLGLAICHQLVHLMKGTISANSKKGSGSEFTLSIPFDIAKKENWKEKSINERFDAYKGARVLYVEDNLINREIGLELLKLAEIEATPAENGVEALELMNNHHYDLILMDIQMPFMDGLTTARKIREREKEKGSRPVPIVALTAHILEEDINLTYESGMNGHISKPISVGQLNREFEKWLSSYKTGVHQIEKGRPTEKPPLPGVDLHDVMERFDGNYKLLLDSLSSFVSDYALMSGLLLSLGNQQKEGELKKEVHTLKGVLGSLGLRELQAMAVDLEKRLDENRNYDNELKLFCFELEDLIQSLEGKL